MSEVESLVEGLLAELERRYPLTDKQLTATAKSLGFAVGPADVRRVLESDPRFSLAGNQPRCWRRARPQDAGTDVCAACDTEKSCSYFRTTAVSEPICFDCEANGRTARPRTPPSEPHDPFFHFDGTYIQPSNRTSRRGAAGYGYVDPHERLAYVTKGGSAYHFREDCEALRSGQAEAVNMGQRLHAVRLVQLSTVSATRHPCARCAS
ncbi:hypothetical protein GCM10009798_13010 [Nocardioides panacihumi]|uniref:Uncharacterized protein n=1 Tax=Nocardioides panacihumi TaxID=400774 RepID=A0ABN2QMK5_9ACTN